MIHSYVKVQFRFEGFHAWPAAPDEVSFLRSAHRHEFHVSIEVAVGHDDREIEFFILKRQMQAHPICAMKNLGSMSCEMIAKEFIVLLRNLYGDDRFYNVEVSEDGENAAVVIYDSLSGGV